MIEYLANTLIRFDMEREIYRRREHSELGVDELCELTLEVQRRVYGDAVEPESLSPWLWASVQHFYFEFTSFYNYPYTFGYLLNAWLWSRAGTQGPGTQGAGTQGAGFLGDYEAFLVRSGSASAEDAALETLGIDLRDPAFWSEALECVAATASP